MLDRLSTCRLELALLGFGDLRLVLLRACIAGLAHRRRISWPRCRRCDSPGRLEALVDRQALARLAVETCAVVARRHRSPLHLVRIHEHLVVTSDPRVAAIADRGEDHRALEHRRAVPELLVEEDRKRVVRIEHGLDGWVLGLVLGHQEAQRYALAHGCSALAVRSLPRRFSISWMAVRSQLSPGLSRSISGVNSSWRSR